MTLVVMAEPASNLTERLLALVRRAWYRLHRVERTVIYAPGDREYVPNPPGWWRVVRIEDEGRRIVLRRTR